MACLYVVATPIGHLDDLSTRAKTILGSVDWIAAEDKRHSVRLLNHCQIHTPLIALHQHNEAEQVGALIKALQKGERGALITDAGTPGISDPGRRLVQAAHEAGLPVSPIPGPSAVVAALSVSGLTADSFIFLGFLPSTSSGRKTIMQAQQDAPFTLVTYEAPHRIQACVADWISVLGADRPAVLARELTKTFETIVNGSLQTIDDYLKKAPEHCLGEMVLMIGSHPRTPEACLKEKVLEALRLFEKDVPESQAVRWASQLYGVKKNTVYDWCLERKEAQ